MFTKQSACIVAYVGVVAVCAGLIWSATVRSGSATATSQSVSPSFVLHDNGDGPDYQAIVEDAFRIILDMDRPEAASKASEAIESMMDDQVLGSLIAQGEAPKHLVLVKSFVFLGYSNEEARANAEEARLLLDDRKRRIADADQEMLAKYLSIVTESYRIVLGMEQSEAEVKASEAIQSMIEDEFASLFVLAGYAPVHYVMTEGFIYLGYSDEESLAKAEAAMLIIIDPQAQSNQCKAYLMTAHFCIQVDPEDPTSIGETHSLGYLSRLCWDEIMESCAGIIPLCIEPGHGLCTGMTVTETCKWRDNGDPPAPGTCVRISVSSNWTWVDCNRVSFCSCFEETKDPENIDCEQIEFKCLPSGCSNDCPCEDGD